MPAAAGLALRRSATSTARSTARAPTRAPAGCLPGPGRVRGRALARRAAAARRSLELAGAPARRGAGRPVRLAQALDNLIPNAIEHGGLRVQVEARTFPAGVRISVSDRPARRSAREGGTPARPATRPRPSSGRGDRRSARWPLPRSTADRHRRRPSSCRSRTAGQRRGAALPAAPAARGAPGRRRMSRRARAIGFAAAALACAALAAALAGGYRTDIESQLGPLRRVVVARGSRRPGRCVRPMRRGCSRCAGSRSDSCPPGRSRRRSRRSAARRRRRSRRAPTCSPASSGPAAPPPPRLARGSAPAERRWRSRSPAPRRSRRAAAIRREPGRRDRHHRARSRRRQRPNVRGGRRASSCSPSHSRLIAEAARPARIRGGVLDGDPRAHPPEALRLIQAENFARQVRLIPH